MMLKLNPVEDWQHISFVIYNYREGDIERIKIRVYNVDLNLSISLFLPFSFWKFLKYQKLNYIYLHLGKWAQSTPEAWYVIYKYICIYNTENI